jgi:hypothetical protein
VDDACQLGIAVRYGDTRGHGAIASGQDNLTFVEDERPRVLNRRIIGEARTTHTGRENEQSTEDATEEEILAHACDGYAVMPMAPTRNCTTLDGEGGGRFGEWTLDDSGKFCTELPSDTHTGQRLARRFG